MAHVTREQLPPVFRVGRFKVYWSEVSDWSCEMRFGKPLIHTVNLYDGTQLVGQLHTDTETKADERRDDDGT